MKRKPFYFSFFISFVLLSEVAFLTASSIYPVAILSFSERGTDMKDQGNNVRDMLFAGLADSPDMMLVEREDMDKMLKEAELNLSGVVSADQAIQIGQLTGVKILITGSVFKIENSTHIVAKIIGTETGRALGKSVSGVESLDILTKKLTKLVIKSLQDSAYKLVASQIGKKIRIEQVRSRIKGKSLPTVVIDITENLVGGLATYPAAETELVYFYKQLGGQVIDKQKGDTTKAEFRIVGNGVSEFSTRHKNLVSVKARLEVKILDREGDVVAIDRQTAIKLDLNEKLAGKSALQEASLLIAERLLPKLAETKKK